MLTCLWRCLSLTGMSKLQTKPYMPPSREGKVNLAIWTDPARRRRIKIMAARTGRPIVEIIESAIDRELAQLEAKFK